MIFVDFLRISDDIIDVKEENVMVEKNVKKIKARRQRITNGFNTGTRDMKLKTAYKRKKRWSENDISDHRFLLY